VRLLLAKADERAHLRPSARATWLEREVGLIFPMKIAFYNLTTTTKSGGIETFNWELGRFMAGQGHEVHLYGGRGPIRPYAHPGLTVRTYPYTPRERFPNLGTRFRKFMERLTFARHAWKDLAAGRYDYIYIGKPYDLPWVLLAARRSKAKVVYGSGGTEFFPGYRFLVKRVDIFTACSHFNADEIEAYTGIRPHVLYNGVDVFLFRPQPPDPELGRSLALAEGVPVLVTACRLIGWKGVDDAIRAVGALRDQGLNVRHLVLGDGEVRPALERLSRDLGLEDSVTFLGQVNHEELPRYYALAAAAVFSPVGAETFGISIAEAMACGVPVVATKVGGIPEMVGEEGALLAPPRDVAGLARALAELLRDSGLRARLAQSARRRVEERFTWTAAAQRFEELRIQAERASEAS